MFSAVLISAVIWHWWIGLAIMLGVLPVVIATIVGYFVKVVAPRYNSRHQRLTRSNSVEELDSKPGDSR